jgi:hypothetical protein
MALLSCVPGRISFSALKTGSPKPTSGFAPCSLRANTRKALRLATDGNTLTACRFNSQAASR